MPTYWRSQIQRTPIVNRTATGFALQRGGSSESWPHPLIRTDSSSNARMHPPQPIQRQQMGRQADHSYRSGISGATSERSDSANEVEKLLVESYQPRMRSMNGGWVMGINTRPAAQRCTSRHTFRECIKSQYDT